jgi:hypothetical protein
MIAEEEVPQETEEIEESEIFPSDTTQENIPQEEEEEEYIDANDSIFNQSAISAIDPQFYEAVRFYVKYLMQNFSIV